MTHEKHNHRSTSMTTTSPDLDTELLTPTGSIMQTLIHIIYIMQTLVWYLYAGRGSSGTTKPSLCRLWTAACAKVQADNLRRTFIRLHCTIHREISTRLTQRHCFISVFFSETGDNFFFFSPTRHQHIQCATGCPMIACYISLHFIKLLTFVT